jgi:glutaminyl-peptide cyclotransferase
MILKNMHFLLLIFFSLFTNCKDNKQPAKIETETNEIKFANPLIFETPVNNSSYKKGDLISIKFKKTIDSIKIDSIQLFENNFHLSTFSDKTLNYDWNSGGSKLGGKTIRIEVFIKGVASSKMINIILKSRNKPKVLGFKIIKTYPHSSDAYTQGLIYENGFFYESDGQYEKSALRKVKMETGESVNYAIMPPGIFAEGIALYNDKIYQLSWREKTCFVYNKKTFTLERQFQYAIEEGWGLTYDGKYFLMTDGSNIVYKIDPQTFEEVDRIEVMDNNGPIESLNELEYINGLIYANVYQTDNVVVIDPSTGEVKAKISFKGLLPKTDYKKNTDVLNGIGFNPENGHLYITGKNWPKLFEVSITDNKLF